MDRRDFLKGALGAAGAASLGAAGWRAFAEDEAPRKKPLPGIAPVASDSTWGGMELRQLGRTGWRATILGFGGYPISEVRERQALATIEEALDEGVNYVDTASTYGDHKSEEYLGKVLPARPRGSFFLATKTLQRGRAAAEKEIGASLRALKVQPDLLQIHAVNDMANLDAVMRKGGSFEAALAAKEAGKVKHIGITGHTRPEVIAAALDRYAFDTILIPLSAPDVHVRSFEEILPKAREKGAAVIAMKVLAGGHAPGRIRDLTPLFHYAWSLPVATAIIGVRTRDEVRTALAAARSFKPLTEERKAEVVAQAKVLGNVSTLWWKRV